MAAGTVGYTDTRGNKDYTSIIANQIGKRLREASDMASDERAYAAGMAEAGGTSLEEAGIGKGYFFGRALGSRFGGDRIARTRGRMGMGGAGTNPASNYKQRFRGGFDYKVSNNIITDTAPLSNAVVQGLRGVQGGLIQVASAISRQDSTMDGLATTQADMAKAIMFNGYLFQMFMSQQKSKSGRASLAREERSLEGGGYGFGGGGIGGSGFGGAGGGRGMINVTPAGSGAGGGSGTSGGGARNSFARDASFFTSNILSSASRIGSSSLSAGKGLNSVVTGTAKTYKPLASGDIVGLMKNPKTGMSIYDELGISTAQVTGQATAKKSDSIIMAAAKMANLSPDKTKSLEKLITGGIKNPEFMDDALAASKKFPDLYQNVSPAGKRILQIRTLAEQFGRKPDAIADDMMSAVMNLGDYNTRVAEARKGFTGPDALFNEQFYNDYMKMHEDVYGAVAKKYGNKNADEFMKLGLFGASEGLLTSAEAATHTSVIADKLMKHYPDMTYESLEKAVLMARVGDMAEQGVGSAKIVKAVRKQLGNNVADDLFLKYSEDILSNTKVGAVFGKGSGMIGFRRLLKAIPIIGLGAGIVFGIQRALEGDIMGAALEVGSGVLGLTPATTGLGLGIDGFLLARDLGVTPMATGGITDGAVNAMIGEKGREGVFPLEGTEGRKTFKLFGEGLVDGMVSKKKNYIALHDEGLYGGLERAKNGGFFNSLQIEATLPRDAFKNIKLGLRRTHVDVKVPNDIKDFLKWFNNNKKTEGMSIVPDVGQGLESIVLNSGKTTLTAEDNVLYLQAIGKENESLALQTTADGQTLTTTVINNNYYNQSNTGGTGEGGNEVLGQAYNSDLEKFIMNYSIMSK